MSRSTARRFTETSPVEGAPLRAIEGDARAAEAVVVPLVGLVAVRVEALDEAQRSASLRVGRELVEARLDPSVDLAVARTALARGERVIAQREPEGWLVLGALRTAATPGVDEGEEFVIKARRVAVEADHELSLVSGAASLVIRAFGQVETLAESITARASSVHKIIGRVIRLN